MDFSNYFIASFVWIYNGRDTTWILHPGINCIIDTLLCSSHIECLHNILRTRYALGCDDHGRHLRSIIFVHTKIGKSIRKLPLSNNRPMSAGLCFYVGLQT